MVRGIFIPTDTTLHLHLPAEFVGKRIEVMAFEAAEAEQPFPASPAGAEAPDSGYETRLARIRAVAAKTPLDLSDYRFDRDDANNYDDE
jgi:hypothetical protein